MRRLFYRLLLAAASLLPLGGAVAQSSVRVLTTYYDSARTQRRAVYGVELRGTQPDTVLQGPYRRFYRAGSLEELGHFSAGQADSIWTRYYPARVGLPPAVARRLPMRAGQPDGFFSVFYQNGRIAQRGTFRQGQLVDSLVSSRANGQPRLLANFDSSSSPGLHGSFRQWYGAFMAQPLTFGWLVNKDMSARSQSMGMSRRNPYPRRDTARYLTGALTAGRLTGAYTEHDADGEPRVRIMYTAQGQRRHFASYYPVLWLRYEMEDNGVEWPADSLMHSRPAYARQAAGPYMLEQSWSYSYGSVGEIPVTRLSRAVRTRHPNLHGDVVGYRGQLLSSPSLSATVAARLPAYQPPTDCNHLYALYVANGKPRQPAKPTDERPLGRRNYPPLSFYTPHYNLNLKPVRGASRWRPGEADTTGATHRPARRLSLSLPAGRRAVLTRRTTRVFAADGQQESYSRRHWLGSKSVRYYYPDGTKQEAETEGLLGRYSRAWDATGQRTKWKVVMPLGEKPGRRLRQKLKKMHPLRGVQRSLRKFHPMQPLYHAVRRRFPRKDHHKPKHPHP